MKSNGSSKNYVNLLEGAGVKDVPKVATIRKAVSQYLNLEMVSSFLITYNLVAVNSGKNLIRGRNKNGKKHKWICSKVRCMRIKCFLN